MSEWMSVPKLESIMREKEKTYKNYIYKTLLFGILT